MKRLAALAVLGWSLACSGGGPNIDESQIEGTWVHEENGAPALGRTILPDGYTSLRRLEDFVYVDGVPVPLRGGFAYYYTEQEMPGGAVVDEALVVYYDDGSIAYDEIISISDTKMTLRSPYVTSTVAFDQVAALP